MRIRSLMVAGPLVFAVLGPGVPAEANVAAGPAISPGNGSVVTSSSVRITVKAGIFGGQLYVNDTPRDSGKNRVLSWTLNGHTYPNGTYRVLLKDPVIALNNSQSTFKLAVPAYAPSGVQAKVSGGKVTVSWNRGDEPDLTGYTVSSSLGKGRSVGMGACGGGRCSVTLSVGNVGGQMGVQVVARRKGAAPSGAASRTVKLSGTGNGGNGNNNPVPPPPNNYTGPTPGNNTAPDPFPTVQPGPDWSTDSPQPKPEDPFSSAGPDPEVDTSLMPQPVADTRTATAADSLQWGKSVAIALVLLLCAGHLGTWTRRLRSARAGGPAGPRIIHGSAHARVEANRHHIEAALAAARTTTDEDGAAKPKRRRFSKKRPSPAPAADLVTSDTLLDLEAAPAGLKDLDGTDLPSTTPTDHSLYRPPAQNESHDFKDGEPSTVFGDPAPDSSDGTPADQSPDAFSSREPRPAYASYGRSDAGSAYQPDPDATSPSAYQSAREALDPSAYAATNTSYAFADSSPGATDTDRTGPLSAARDFRGSGREDLAESTDGKPSQAESGIAALIDLAQPEDEASFAPDPSRSELLEVPRPRRFRLGRRS